MLKRISAALSAALIASPMAAAGAASFSTLVALTGGVDGIQPSSIVAENGLLYVAVQGGGQYNSGEVISVDPVSGATSTIHAFTGGSDGDLPDGLVAIGDVVYGAAFDAGDGPAPNGGGTLFRLDPATKRDRTLYRFSLFQGGLPEAPILAGKALYGALLQGTNFYDGAVYKLDLQTGQVSTLYNFLGSDGAFPLAVAATRTTLYGTASLGGAKNFGVIYAIELASGGHTTRYTFQGRGDGSNPDALVAGNGHYLYGLATDASISRKGTVFRINTLNGEFKTLYRFHGRDDGSNPQQLIYQPGMLTGICMSGGSAGQGTIFQLDLTTGKETTVHAFTGGTGGAAPSWLTLYNGVFYGSTFYGTAGGTVFKFTP